MAATASAPSSGRASLAEAREAVSQAQESALINPQVHFAAPSSPQIATPERRHVSSGSSKGSFTGGKSKSARSIRSSADSDFSAFFFTGATASIPGNGLSERSFGAPPSAPRSKKDQQKSEKGVELPVGQGTNMVSLLRGRVGTTPTMAAYITCDAEQRKAMQELGQIPENFAPVELTDTMRDYADAQKTPPPTKPSAAAEGKKPCGKKIFLAHPGKKSQVDRIVFNRDADFRKLIMDEDEYKYGYNKIFKSKAGRHAFSDFRKRGLKEVASHVDKPTDLGHDAHAPVEYPYPGDEHVSMTQTSEMAYRMAVDPATCDVLALKFPQHFRKRFTGAAGSPSWHEGAGHGKKTEKEGENKHRKSVAGAVLTARVEGLRQYPGNPNLNSAVDAIVNGAAQPMDPEQYHKVYRGAAGRGSWEKPQEDPLHSLPDALQRYGQRSGLKTQPKSPSQMSRFLQSFGRDDTFEQDPASHERGAAEMYDGSAGRATWHHTRAQRKCYPESRGFRPGSATERVELAHVGHVPKETASPRSPSRRSRSAHHGIQKHRVRTRSCDV